ncbi:MAG TPA: hypothetical protein VF950_07160 [Planctomycetota bacterium]
MLIAWACLLAAQAAPPKAEVLTAELRGLMVVEGLNVKNFNKTEYTGDTLFLKIAFRDAEGKAAKPIGVFNAAIATPTERLAAVSRTVKKESWKAEAGKIAPATASPDLIAFDEKTGELWIGLVKIPAGGAELRFDVSFRISGLGAWEWKKLSPPFEAAARPPDKK